MNAPKIEKNVPMIRGAIDKYRWLDQVEKGDSFIWSSHKLPNLRNAAYNRKIRLASRKIDDENHRVWIKGWA